jgi:hypothetical protein
MKLLKNLKNNKTKLVSLLTILVGLWLILYFIPNLIASLLNTFLGNIILLLSVILITITNYKYGILLMIILLVLKRYSYLSTSTKSTKEGFTWTNKTTDDFLKIQNTVNPNIVFDTNIIQESQASQEEVEYFNEHGIWPWTKETIKLYQEAYESNPYIRNNAEEGTNYARTIYNQAAILRILAMQKKEGQFLLNGISINDPSGNEFNELENSGTGTYGYNSGLISNPDKDIIRCKSDNSGLERITFDGNGSIFGQQIKTSTDIDNCDLEDTIPGFKFINKKKCNPCAALNQTPDYSCPFSLQVKDHSTHVSKVWKYLWDL